MISASNIVQSYGKQKKTILQNISVNIKDRAVTALIGANGAGKSTLLGVLSKLLEPVSGTVTLHNKNLAEYKSKDLAKQISFLRQTQSVSIRLTIRDLVEFGRFPHCGGRLKEIDCQKVEESLRFLNIIDIQNKYLDELSGGQRQRAFIAMILAQDTPYIFLDEPLNNLDIKYSVEMMKIIKKLVKELDKTVVIVLHDINFASAYADHIIAMKDGKIVSQGIPLNVIQKEVLDDVFDHDFHIVNHDGTNVCLFFDDKGTHSHSESMHYDTQETPSIVS